MLALLAVAQPLLCGASDEGLLGSLYVTTSPPEAAIYVNGELRGVSPCGIGDVAVGTVEVRAERQGFTDATASVEVTGGAITRIDLTLSPQTNVGSIAVLVEPQGSSIEVDRVPAGRTPKVLINVVAGTHRLTVSRTGYLPFQSTVTLAPGERAVLNARLQPSSGAAAAAPAAAELARMGELHPDSIPPTADLPEERALEPVRRLVADRRYDEALAALEQLSRDAGAELLRRIGRERLVIGRIRKVAEAGYARLRDVEGQQYVLMLRGGIRYACTLVAVEEKAVKVRTGEREQSIPLSRISAEQIVRLASHSMDPNRAANRARFALLYAAEGDYDLAYEELRAAAQGGYEVASDKSYVDAERLWAAAVEREERLRALARAGSLPGVMRASLATKKVPLLVDTLRGRDLPAELRSLALASGFEIEEHEGPFRPEEAERPAVLLIYDPGVGSSIPPYDRREVQHIVNFIRAGGGLVFIGAVRPMPSGERNVPSPQEAQPFAALLRWAGVLVQPGSLVLGEDAPPGFPRQYVPAFPAAAHPVSAGVRQAVFAAPVAPLAVGGTARVILRCPPLLSSEATGEPAPPLAAASVLGKGRVLVFSAAPLMQQSPYPQSPLSVNDGRKILLNGLIWVSDPAREATQ